MVNFFVLEEVPAPAVYCNVPVVPLAPSVTEFALLPRVPFALALFIVAIDNLPAVTVRAPERVLAPLSVTVPALVAVVLTFTVLLPLMTPVVNATVPPDWSATRFTEPLTVTLPV